MKKALSITLGPDVTVPATEGSVTVTVSIDGRLAGWAENRGSLRVSWRPSLAVVRQILKLLGV